MPRPIAVLNVLLAALLAILLTTLLSLLSATRAAAQEEKAKPPEAPASQARKDDAAKQDDAAKARGKDQDQDDPKKKDKDARKLTSGLLGAFKLRGIGPALMSGRIGDIAIHPKKQSTWYVAVASGGVWKTENAGTTWKPIFDGQGSYSIGCVAVDPGNPDVVWVGTGETTASEAWASATGSTVRMTAAPPGRRWVSKRPSTSARSSSIRAIPTRCGWRPRDRSGRRAATAACTKPRTEALPGRRCSRSARTPESRTSCSIRETPTWSTPRRTSGGAGCGR